jgi:hypothetical protein
MNKEVNEVEDPDDADATVCDFSTASSVTEYGSPLRG